MDSNDNNDKVIFNSRYTVSQLIDLIEYSIGEDEELAQNPVTLSESQLEALADRIDSAIQFAITDFVDDLIDELYEN